MSSPVASYNSRISTPPIRRPLFTSSIRVKNNEHIRMQARQIEEIMSSSTLSAGEVWYVVSSLWFVKWARYVKFNDPTPEIGWCPSVEMNRSGRGAVVAAAAASLSSPGPIDNDVLVDGRFDLNRVIHPEKQCDGMPSQYVPISKEKRLILDYVLIPEAAWRLLCEWYGGGPHLGRTVYFCTGVGHKVDVHPLSLYLCVFHDEVLKAWRATDSNPHMIVTAEHSKVCDLLEPIRRAFHPHFNMKKLRLRDYFNHTVGAVLDEETMVRHIVIDEQHVLLEWETQTDLWTNGKPPPAAATTTTTTMNGAALSHRIRSLVAYGEDSDDNERDFDAAQTPHNNPHIVVGGHEVRDNTSWDSSSSSESSIVQYRRNVLNGENVEECASDYDDILEDDYGTVGLGNVKSSYNTRSGNVMESPAYKRYKHEPLNLTEHAGVCGLQNLGNTCFMNSALQCLLHTKEITEYFLENRHLHELNRSNPIGTGGVLAESYGSLVHEMWNAGRRCVAPRDFKLTLGRYAPQFQGYEQHDAQELLAYLLDGLHEDLNRVREKPYTETVECNNECKQHSIAEEAWRRHLLRNQSVIVDMFQGQLRSKVTCPECHRVSIKFDPFMYMSLPLSTKRTSSSFTHETSKQLVRCLCFDTTVANHRSNTVTTNCGPDTCVSDFVGLVYKVLNSHEYTKSECYKWNEDEGLLPCHADDLVFDSFEKYLFCLYVGVDRDSYRVPVYSVQCFNGKWTCHGPPRLIAYHPERTRFNDWRELAAKNVNVIDTIEAIDELCRMSPEPYNARWVSSESNGRRIVGKLPRKFKLVCVKTCSKPVVERRRRVSLVKRGSANTNDRSHQTFAHARPIDEQVTLTRCFQEFTREERLGVDDEWYCSTCKKHQRANKKLDIFKLPRILVVHLKRFSYNHMHRRKISTLVECPLKNLDLADLTLGDDRNTNCKYDLFAVSNHSGYMGFGHYTAYAKVDERNGNWYDFDDSIVSQVHNPRYVVSDKSYVLLYRRQE